MSHDQKHGEGCRCGSCNPDKENHEKTSIEEAGGVTAGFTGHIHGYNADTEARLAGVLTETGKWVEKESGSLLGHIKAAIYVDDGHGITLNLINLENGVEHHGVMSPEETVNFNIMSAVLDVDAHELEHVMMHALEDSGIDYHLDSPHHHDDDDGKCSCGHHHEHHHEDEEEKVCHCKACEERRKESEEKPEKKSFWSKLKRN